MEELNNNYLENINEVKYLAQENTYRYRLIMKFLFSKYEEAEYWLYKEEIYSEVRKNLPNYLQEECDRDLEFLLANGSITKLQDTQNINTINDFKYHNFRYQLTDKAVIIERMTIELEEIEVKVATLEPRLFERINNLIQKIVDIYSLDEKQIYNLWVDINNDFKCLNEHYQDFLKKFHEAKTEELLKSEAFLEFKTSVINYINDFINSYIKNATKIKNNLLEIDEEKTKYLMETLISYQKKAPKMSQNFDYDKLKKVNYGKWQSLKKWFVSSDGPSEGERLLEATQNIIQKLYKYATSLIELHGNMINRKEEYKYICHLFDNAKNIEEAARISLAVFGVRVSKHYKTQSTLNTDSLIKSYDVQPLEIPINTTNKNYKFITERTVIVDKTYEKEQILKKAIQEELFKKVKLKNLIKNGKIELQKEIKLDEIERRYVLDLIDKYRGKETKESEFGYNYSITDKGSNKCKIISPDGIFELSERTIVIKVGDNFEQ